MKTGSIEKLSDKCKRTQIIKNLFHGLYNIFCLLIFLTNGREGGRTQSGKLHFFNHSLNYTLELDHGLA